MKLVAVYFSIIVYSVMVPNIAKADEWKQYQPRPWPKVTIDKIMQPVNEREGDPVGSVINTIALQKARLPEKQCNKKTEFGNWIPVYCGSES